MTTEMQSLKLDQIRIDGGTQSRVAIDEQTVSDYADLYRSDVDLKPVIVFFDGATYWLADGFHRFWANKRINSDYVFAYVHQGTQRDAQWYSFGANSEHGLRRTREDVAQILKRIFTDEKWVETPDSEIASHTGIPRRTINRHRDAHLGQMAKIESGKRKVKRNGTTYKMNTGNIGQSRKRKFKPTGGIAKDAFSTPAPHSLQSRVPMKNVDLPLNNPRKAAHCMVSVYGEEYMRQLCDELNHLFKEGNSND